MASVLWHINGSLRVNVHAPTGPLKRDRTLTPTQHPGSPPLALESRSACVHPPGDSQRPRWVFSPRTVLTQKEEK